MWAYLGGDPQNEKFNQAIRTGFFNKELMNGQGSALLISLPAGGWRKTLNRLFPERPPVEMRRLHYVARQSKFDMKPIGPEGFTLHFIDESLQIDGDLPDDVQRVLDQRSAADEPDRAAFGYVALYNGKYAAHAVIDCIVGDQGDIGLVTDEAYRRRGLAVATSAATIRYGLAHGLGVVFWDCAAYNLGSVRAAERLGLKFAFEHTMMLLVYDETGHWLNLAWAHLDAGKFRESLDFGEQLAARNENPPPVGDFLIAAAWGGLGDRARALHHLNTAADRGWDGLSDTENCAPLSLLHGTPEWEAVLARIRSNGSLT
jgi:RimJ/RimL family protein N-acetyltransferase